MHTLRFILPLIILIYSSFSNAQTTLTPELLLKLGRVKANGITVDNKNIIFTVSTPDIAGNTFTKKKYILPVSGGAVKEMATSDGITNFEKRISPDGKYIILVKEIKITKISGNDFYPEMSLSDVRIYNSLTYRHWDQWEDGKFNHLFLHKITDGKEEGGKDIMEGEPYHCPQKPFGDMEDYIWSPDSRKIIYVTKKKAGTEYTLSTNTDLFSYDITTGKTTNISEGMSGYDIHPSFSSSGTLAWLSMKRDGYESDKNDIIVSDGITKINLTEKWDGTVNSFIWSKDGKKIFFLAAIDGTEQLFEASYSGDTKKTGLIKQLTTGDFDVSEIIAQINSSMIVSRTDMNHAAELYSVDLLSGKMTQLTHVNDSIYKTIGISKTEKRYMTTTDGKKMLVWVIYPPDFDPAKKYPALLYCQGGPQSPLTQFYSFRWNFQLMAANGYIVVAPNRRGLPGFGVAWNEQISKDYGGQNMQDYLTAVDEISKEKFIDKNRIGCVGASYGGFSVYYLAGIHQNRFKSFIAHDGIFNNKSMYGTTEELWFPNWDFGGAYWDINNPAAMKTYQHYDPSNLVSQWNTPILIFQGGKDFRTPEGQSMEAFQAAQLRGIKSRFIYFPEENHWVLKPQNAIIWHSEFYKWLKETL
ncbi:MAG: peptidase S9 [Bacteroidetes bacterium RIFCSPLOWO2_12_FULL_37_12]|nr:MAG: peptidase S9 [Bacteroidetes bacterium RIFCSPLOWO2_12_FULL_37_12]